MNNIVYTYAFLKTLSDQGEDYVESIFLPFVIRILPKGKYFARYEVNKLIREGYDFEIPTHTLGYLLLQASKNEYIEIRVKQKDKREIEGHYKLTPKGIQFQNAIGSIKDTNREINELIADIKSFFGSHNISITDEKIQELISSFFKKYFEPLIQFLSPNSPVSELSLNTLDTYENFLVDYIKNVEHSKPELYKIIEKMFFGSILSALLMADNLDDVKNLQKTKFPEYSVYVDTNIVFSLLGWHRNFEANEATKQLFNLLKSDNFKIKIFKFTIDEIVSVLSRYDSANVNGRHENIEENIYGTFLKNGITKTEVREKISRIDKIIEDLGIEIDQSIDVNLNNYQTKIPEYFDLIQTYKPMDHKYNLNHDLAAIDTIKQMRGNKTIRHIEDAKVIFLTQDIRLNNFVHDELGHRDRNSIGEVVLDNLLTTILWIKNPKINISISMIVTAHSKNMFTKWRILDQFFKEIQKMKDAQEITDKQVMMLLYNNFIDYRLREFNEDEGFKITTDLIRQEIVKANSVIDSEKKDLAKEIQRKHIRESLNARNYYQHHVHFGITIIKIAVICISALFALSQIFKDDLKTLQFGFFSVMLIVTLITFGFGPLIDLQKKCEKWLTDKFFDRWEAKMQFGNKPSS